MIVVNKHPDAKKRIRLDFTDWLNGAEISSVEWDLSAGLTNAAATNTTTVATLFVTGGTIGQEYYADCKVTTNESESRIEVRSVRINVDRIFQ